MLVFVNSWTAKSDVKLTRAGINPPMALRKISGPFTTVKYKGPRFRDISKKPSSALNSMTELAATIEIAINDLRIPHILGCLV